MVEGPGCKVKGEKMKPKVIGQHVKKISGNALKKYTTGRYRKDSQNGAASPFHSLIGNIISDVQTLGKELFIFFINLEVCLRIHFLMSGGFRLNGTKIDHEGGGESDTHELVLHLSNDQLAFNLSSVDIRSASESLERVKFMQSLDICSDNFSHTRALSLFMEQGNRYICDVLLDQNILPGVGNIIKNEALFDSGLKPDTKVSAVTEKHISHLIKMTRDFSMIFYKCRRDGKQLSKFYKIYHKSVCKQCDSRVVTTRLGDDNPRITSFCPKCQNNDNSKFDFSNKLPRMNSLLGWVTRKDTHGEESGKQDLGSCSVVEEKQPWDCLQCTFINSDKRTKCEMCLAPKNETEKVENRSPNLNSITVNHDRDRQLHNAPFIPFDAKNRNEILTSKNIQLSNSGNTTAIVEDNEMSFQLDILDSIYDESDEPTSNAGTQQNCHGIKRKCVETCDSILSNKRKCNDVPSERNQMKKGHMERPHSLLPDPIRCPEHNVLCFMRQVHKKGNNLHRMFWSCPAKGKCSFFKWADLTFPHCEGHGLRSVLRTVLKQGVNNGRKFFACPKEKTNQCGFFLWAEAPVQNS